MTETIVKEHAARREAAFARAANRAERILAQLRKRESAFALMRLVATIVVLAVVASLFARLGVAARVGMVALAVAIVFVLSAVHRRLQKHVRFWTGIAKSYRLAHARILRETNKIRESLPPWHEPLVSHVPGTHLYATDLDIHTGLFTLLDTCSTREGSEHLLHLLLDAGLNPEPAKDRELRQKRTAFLARQSQLIRAVEALRFDEDFLYQSIRAGAHPEKDSANALQAHLKPKSLAAYILMSTVGIVAWALMLLPALGKVLQGQPDEFLMRLVTYAFIPFMGVILFKPLVDAAQSLERHTRVLDVMMGRLETLRDEPAFSSLSPLKSTAVTTLRRLRMALSLLSVRNNPVFWLALHALIPYDSIMSLVLLTQVRRTAERLPQWIRDVAEFDVCCAFARFHSEDPGVLITPVSEPDPGVVLELRDAGHPLLPPRQRVANTLRMEDTTRLGLLTGSNMSGKSTFLRAVGVNLVLAACGAPVCASYVATRPRRVLCAVRVDDSVAEGTSYFYAEVKRLKAMLDDLQQHPGESLFLIDEIFRGTNNRERFVGAWHIIQALVEQSSPGFVSTHDLALTALADKDSRIRNMHFREHVESDHLIFDYTLREGPSPTTNALLIMNLQGLPVPRNADVHS